MKKPAKERRAKSRLGLRAGRVILSDAMRKSPRARQKSRAGMGGGAGLRLLGIPGGPEIREGENLASVLAGAARKAGLGVEDGGNLVVAQEIGSEAEGAGVLASKDKAAASGAAGVAGVEEN